jgi:hypothetical protein
MHTTCIITPSYIGDIAQFSLLRKSIEIYARDYPHIVIVHSEDYPAFNSRFGASRNITILKTSDILPSFVENRRKSKIKLVNRFKKRFARKPVEGRYIQQLTKIYALSLCEYDSAAFIDSDVFLCAPLCPDYFLEGEKVKLFRRMATNAESMDFDISTHEIIGNDLHKIHQLFDYIFAPASFKKSSAVSLLNLLNSKYGNSWVNRFFSERRPSEYNLLGYSATIIEKGLGYSLIECNPADIHHSLRFKEDTDKFREEVDSCLRHPKHFFLIQSSLNLNIRHITDAFDVVMAQSAQQGVSLDHASASLRRMVE